jgi:hypothetical protein
VILASHRRRTPTTADSWPKRLVPALDAATPEQRIAQLYLADLLRLFSSEWTH